MRSYKINSKYDMTVNIVIRLLLMTRNHIEKLLVPKVRICHWALL